VAERPFDQLTLREQFTHCDHLLRELVDHLEQSFLPKIQKLDESVQPLTNPSDPNAVPNFTIRNQVAAILSSDDFAQALHKKLQEYLKVIEQSAGRALGER